MFYSVNKFCIQKEALLQAKEDIFKRQKNKIYILINTFVFCNMQNNNERIFFFWRFSNRMMSLVVKIVSKNLLDLCLWRKFSSFKLRSFTQFHTNNKKMWRMQLTKLPLWHVKLILHFISIILKILSNKFIVVVYRY